MAAALLEGFLVAYSPAPTVCSICKTQKMALVRKTEKHNDTIYVCANMPKKGKMPCDGFIFDLAQSHDEE